MWRFDLSVSTDFFYALSKFEIRKAQKKTNQRSTEFIKITLEMKFLSVQTFEFVVRTLDLSLAAVGNIQGNLWQYHHVFEGYWQIFTDILTTQYIFNR